MGSRINVTTSSGPLRLAPEAARAYAAGLFDGGGYVSIVRQKMEGSRHGHVYRLVTSISHNNLRSLTDFQNLAGVQGRIYQIPQRGTSNRDSYSLKYDGKAAADLLQNLQPFLLRKLGEANTALEFYNDTHIQQHFGRNGCPEDIWRLRTSLYRRLKKLK